MVKGELMDTMILSAIGLFIASILLYVVIKVFSIIKIERTLKEIETFRSMNTLLIKDLATAKTKVKKFNVINKYLNYLELVSELIITNYLDKSLSYSEIGTLIQALYPLEIFADVIKECRTDDIGSYSSLEHIYLKATALKEKRNSKDIKTYDR